MKYIFMLSMMFLSRVAPAQTPACTAATPQEFRVVFALAIGLNDNLARVAQAGEASPEYRALREKIADFDAQQALPCAAAAAQLLQSEHDAPLARALLELVADHARVAVRTLPQSLATYFDARPDEFSFTLSTLPTTDRCAVVANLDAGWMGLRSAVDPVRATARDTTLAGLKRTYSCDRTKSPPPVQIPRSRERAAPGQRQSRPRWALATPGRAAGDTARA